MNLENKYIIASVCALSVLVSCRKDPAPLSPEQQPLFPPNPAAKIKGMYVLNEGNMNANKASIDYVDFVKGTYTRNIYNEANPGVTKGLGDVGNDIGVYGSKLYVVVNGSNKVEVLDVHTCKRIAQVDIINCRYIYFHSGKAYVSAYLSKTGDPRAANGIVAEIDTGTLTVSRQVTVGRQPEEMAVVGEKLYVANSGAYTPSDYERTVSVVDLSSFRELRRIDVAINLERLKADAAGNLYVVSHGDYYTIASDLFMIDTKTDSMVRDFKLVASNLWIDRNTLYLYSNGFNFTEGKDIIAYAAIDIGTGSILPNSFIRDGTQNSIAIPYGIAINPETQDIFVSDARDYVTPGTLYCFDKDGILKWAAQAGDIPGHFAFVF